MASTRVCEFSRVRFLWLYHLQETQKWLPASDAARPDSQKGCVMAEDGEVRGGNWKKEDKKDSKGGAQGPALEVVPSYGGDHSGWRVFSLRDSPETPLFPLSSKHLHMSVCPVCCLSPAIKYRFSKTETWAQPSVVHATPAFGTQFAST